jgi:hypothetical protein
LDIWVLEDFDYADEVYSKEVLACKTDDNPEQAQDTTISFEQIEDDTEQTNGSTEE